jgi:acyl-CoA synthetase (AMP-forming)/AMP-acid ligase II
MRLHFPDEGASVDYGTLWKAGEAVRCLRAASGGSPVAVALSNTRACCAVLVGAIAAGQPLLSVPMPPRGADLDWYSRFVQRICASSGASTLLLDAALLPAIPPMENVELLSFDDALTLRGPGVADPAAFTLTQFTSGSTSDPRGVVLSSDKVVANLRALLDWLQPGPGDGGCTWLPLSHDMGLIGTLLCALAAAGDEWSRGGNLVVMTPRGFLRNPARWLAACEEYGSTIIAAPNYGYEMAARRRGSVHDLQRLRVCIAGGEPIRASSLERFARTFADSGFNPTAFCPAYGMAEAALAVTGTPTSASWQMAEIETGPDEAGSASMVVSSGPPLAGYDVRITGPGVGEILVKGPSIADRYADGAPVADADGWFRTRDLGLLRDGELYVLGRTDDVFFVGGRNIYALDVEAYAGEVTGVRDGRVVAVPENGALTLVAECEPDFCDRASAHRLARELSQHILTRVGMAPRRVLLAPRNKLPLTSSGKVRRRPLQAALQASQLEILAGSLE